MNIIVPNQFYHSVFSEIQQSLHFKYEVQIVQSSQLSLSENILQIHGLAPIIFYLLRKNDLLTDDERKLYILDNFLNILTNINQIEDQIFSFAKKKLFNMKYTQHLMGNIQLDLVQITQFFDQNTYIIARNYKQVNIVAAIILKNFIKRFATVGRKPQFQGCQIYIRLWTGQDLQLAKLIDCYRE